MNVTYTFLVIFGFLARFYCDNSDNGTTSDNSIIGDNSTIDDNSTIGDNSTIEETQTNSSELEVEVNLGYTGLYGGSYYNIKANNPKNLHYVHGTYQSPPKNYYISQHYYRDFGTVKTFDYYLGFGISRMTNNDFVYDDFHYYYHDINRTISENETIPSDFIIACHPNATSLCPENTETICLLNGTIYCMSKIDVVVPCSHNETLQCVNSVVPCVQACIDLADNFENVSLPCLGTVTVLDVYESKNKTLSKVGGTFVIMDALKKEERTFCVTVIVDPMPKEKE